MFIEIGMYKVNALAIARYYPYHSGQEEEGVEETMVELSNGASIVVAKSPAQFEADIEAAIQ